MLHLRSRAIARPSAWENVQEKQGYTPKYATIGHRVLDEDKQAERFPESIYQRLDNVIESVAKASINVNCSTIEEARATLTEIEDVVRVANFACSIPYYLMHSFSDGLFQKPLDQNLIGTPENSLRDAHMIAHRDETFSHVDCDLGTLLYLSIGEVLGIPLQMSEIPKHNFVRWRLGNGNHINWDTNYGFNIFTDAGYAARYGVEQEQINNSGYLADLNVENTHGYFCFVRGLTFQRQDRLPEAIAEYRAGITKYPKSPSARNNIAWQFVSKKSVRTIVSKEEALILALEACTLHRTDNNLDTLACVFAEHGDFASAIATEQEAYALNQNPSYLKMIEAFKAGKTWLDINQQ